MGTCANCKREWYTTKRDGVVTAKYIPTCPEAEIAAICEDCFDALPSKDVIRLVLERQNQNSGTRAPVEEVGVRHIYMTATEHLLVNTGIAAWVLYLKGEAGEPPFEQGALAL